MRIHYMIMSALHYVFVYFLHFWTPLGRYTGVGWIFVLYDGIHVSKRYEGWARHSAAFWVYLHL